MLVRSAERSEHAGASRPAASSYATAAEQTELTGESSAEDAMVGAAQLWERAARAALAAFDVERALACAERADTLYAAHGQARAAARSKAISGEVLLRAGRHGEARERLTAALAVLRPDPDADTVTALERLAAVEILSGGPDGDRLSAEALLLGQALDVDDGLLADVFTSRAIALYFANRWAEAVADLEYAARLAEGFGDSTRQSRALLNLGEVLSRSDPIAAAGAARAAADLARRGGAVSRLIFSLSNEAEALLLAGEWDEADRVLRDAIDRELPGHGVGSQVESWLAGLRGDIDTASDLAEEYRDRASEDAQDQAGVALCNAIIAATQNRYADALRNAQAVIAQATALGIGHVVLSWAWPLAARCAHTLGDDDSVAQLLALLDDHPVGHLPPLLRAERLLARARLDVAGDGADAAGAFDAAVTALRQGPSPYHLAHGLLDSCRVPHHDRGRDRCGTTRRRSTDDRRETPLPTASRPGGSDGAPAARFRDDHAVSGRARSDSSTPETEGHPGAVTRLQTLPAGAGQPASERVTRRSHPRPRRHRAGVDRRADTWRRTSSCAEGSP